MNLFKILCKICPKKDYCIDDSLKKVDTYKKEDIKAAKLKVQYARGDITLEEYNSMLLSSGK